jgi:saccharopine dehydrogenase-like NADP-dependent oxidoreductase
MREILVLGAGLVARPLVMYLLEVEGFGVTVASRTVSKAQRLIGEMANGRAIAIDVTDDAAVGALIADADLAVSLLPYAYHPMVARHCVAHGIPMVTTSYVKPEMEALDAAARSAGVLLLNEIGVDPGIDHMSAMAVIDQVKTDGGRIVSFTSNTGGLPAPESNDNPLGYKFSWAPRGVLLAGRNDARYLKDGERIDVPGPELFTHHWPAEVSGFGMLEVYPNRDSIPYIQRYGIDGVKSMFRGTLRYPGWCDTLKAIVDLGLLDDRPEPGVAGRPYRALIEDRVASSDGRSLPEATAAHLGLAGGSKVISDLRWLGLFSEEPVPEGITSRLDALGHRMLEQMQYGPGERDMLVMQHEFVAEFADRRERITSTMIDYGVPGGDTSMSRTVGLPAAIAARKAVQGEIDLTGVQVPVLPEIYRPILAELADLGIRFTETREEVPR